MSEWIKCSERLPDQIGSYLAYNKSSGSTYWVFYNSDERWAWENEFIEPTHWMSLPSPPGEE